MRAFEIPLSSTIHEKEAKRKSRPRGGASTLGRHVRLNGTRAQTIQNSDPASLPRRKFIPLSHPSLFLCWFYHRVLIDQNLRRRKGTGDITFAQKEHQNIFSRITNIAGVVEQHRFIVTTDLRSARVRLSKKRTRIKTTIARTGPGNKANVCY